MPLEEGGPNTWTGHISTFRFDPLEGDDNGDPVALPAGFAINSSHLTTDPIAGRTGSTTSGFSGTIIRWTTMQGDGTISLYRDNDNQGFDGAPIATGLPLSLGAYAWDTSGLTQGAYWVYAITSNGLNTTHFYSLVPIVVDRNQPATLFTDVPQSYWAIDYIDRIAMRGIIGGSPQDDTTVNFRPGDIALRSHLSKMVALAAGWPLLNPASPTFADVAPSSTFYSYIETAASHGVTNGYACGGPGEPCDPQSRRYFRPSSNVTRAQTAKMVSVSRGWPIITPANPTFADVPYDNTPGSLYSYIETMAARSIINGYPCGGPGEPCDPQSRPYYRPGNSVTRAQLSKMISLSLDSALAK